MTCIDPGLVAPEDLVAYASGEADARTAAHVAACPACALEAAGYRDAERALRARLFRADCPPTQALGELSLVLLAAQEALAVRAHLALCPHCSGELAALDAALRGDPLDDLRPTPGRLARIVARLVSAPGPEAAHAGVRGAGESASLTYEADGLTVSLTVEAEVSGAVRRWLLLGLLVDEAGGELPTGATVRLLQAGQVAGETALDELGNLVFSGLEAGRYDLEVTLPDRVIAVEGIEVGAAQV